MFASLACCGCKANCCSKATVALASQFTNHNVNGPLLLVVDLPEVQEHLDVLHND